MTADLDSEDALATAALLSPLRERPSLVEPVEVSERRMRRIVPGLEAFVRTRVEAQQSRRRWGLRVWLLAALSTGVGAGLLYARFSQPDQPAGSDGLLVSGSIVEVGAQEQRTVLSGSLQVSPLGRVETEDSSARISTREGLEVELGPSTSARIGELGGARLAQRVRLDAGRVSCSVPKLAPGREFSVATPDALVVVHGTRFSVEVEPDEEGLAKTCVRVSEGRVAVHLGPAAPVFLGPGQQHGCRGPVGAAAQQGEPSDRAATPGAAAVSRAPAPVRSRASEAPTRASADRGTLREETELLRAAVRAEQQGDAAGARSRLRRLLDDYPDSPLREEASRMLTRLSNKPVSPRQGTSGLEPSKE